MSFRRAGASAFATLALALPLSAQVSYERIIKADAEPGSWLTYSRTYQGHRHSPLRQITPANVHRLRPAWIHQINDLNQFQTTPIVADGIMYVSEPPSNVVALDVRTGRPLWAYRRNIPRDAIACCGQVNRGVALLDDAVFLGTIDAHLVALDAKTGRVRWDVEVAEYRHGHSITGAPLALRDRIITGVAGGEYGIRGFLDAFDPKTGKRLWRFWTIPGPGEPGHETWEGQSWKTGSAATWVTGSYDPELNVVFWGTGNPGPDYNGAMRRGDNLYSDSLVAIDAATGKLRWHFQFTPHDTHDWDSNHTPILFSAGGRNLIGVANRNGFYYVLDRGSGKFLRATPFAKQTWAKGFDANGRPIRLPNSEPTLEGAVIYPGFHGGTNWFSQAYDPATGTFFVGVREEGTTFHVAADKYQVGRFFGGGGPRGIPGVEPSGAVKALRAETGEQLWEFRLHSPPWGGVMSTASGLVFGGASEGYLFALDSKTGKPLWRFLAGGPALANPISYLSGGRQYVAVAAGHALFSLAIE
ncbi:MAG: pyrroloquinoline quinone-dependent dehydrogenase [Bryobacteraceae bacterium]